MTEAMPDELTDRETLRAILDAAPDPTVVVDGEGRIVFANLQVERILGYAPSDLVGQAIEVLVPERYRGSHVGHRGRFIADPRVRPMGSGLQLYCLKRDGTEIPIEYRMRRRGEQWRVYDVVIEGVSLIASYRTQFNRIIRSSSFEELVRKMRSRQDELGA